MISTDRDSEPRYVDVFVASIICGLMVVIAVIMAVYTYFHTPSGEYILLPTSRGFRSENKLFYFIVGPAFQFGMFLAPAVAAFNWQWFKDLTARRQRAIFDWSASVGPLSPREFYRTALIFYCAGAAIHLYTILLAYCRLFGRI